jgi:hypothetical protein
VYIRRSNIIAQVNRVVNREMADFGIGDLADLLGAGVGHLADIVGVDVGEMAAGQDGGERVGVQRAAPLLPIPLASPH